MGDTFLTIFFSPPIIIARLPFRALSGPPDIGASIHDAPFSVLNLFEKFKLELIDYISQKIVIDVIAFSFPFLTTLFVSHLISKWLSPKFSFSEILFLVLVFGFLFGILRGTLIVILFYLGFLYLIGKEKKLPDLILEAYTYEYLKNTTDTLSDFFIEQVEQIDDQIKKEDI